MRIFTFFLSVFISVSINAKDYIFERITSLDGLSQNDNMSIHQDSEGYIWIASFDGLNRYDGYEFEVFRSSAKDKNSISGNLIGSIAEVDNYIWIATLGKGINRYNKLTGEFTRIMNTSENPDFLIGSAFSNTIIDSEKRVWVGSKVGLNCIITQADGSLSNHKFIHNSEDPFSITNGTINDIFEDSKGRIFVAAGGLINLMVSGENGELQNKFIHLDNELGVSEVYRIDEIPEGLLLSTSSGLSLLMINETNPEESTFKNSLLSFTSYYQIIDNEKNLWTGGTDGLRLFAYTPKNEFPYELIKHYTSGEDEYSLSNENIRSLAIDKMGILWLGSNGGGVMKCNPRKTRFRHYKKTEEEGSISHNKVFRIFEDKQQNLWMGTEGGGLNFLPASDGRNYTNGFTAYEVNPPGQQNHVFGIADVAPDNNPTPEIWLGVGYNNKLAKVEGEGNDRIVVSNFTDKITSHTMTMYRDEYNAVWIGTYWGGLFRYIPGENGEADTLQQFIPPHSSQVPSDIIRSFMEDSQGRLWVGTDKGLGLLTRREKKNFNPRFKVFKSNIEDTSSLSNDYTVPIIETSNGEIWIGTFGGGINQYIEGDTDTSGTFRALTQDDGLPNNMVKQIIEDDLGNLWISTTKGLSRLSKDRKSFRNFDYLDGLQDMEFVDISGCKRRDGEILFGGINGFNAFYPNEILEDKKPPLLVFNSLEVSNQEIEPNDTLDGNIIISEAVNFANEIVLKHNQNNFTIKFAAIHHSAPTGNQFQYILEGVDEHWVYASSNARFARYTNLKHGEYTFKLNAANNHGVWAKEPKTITIIVKPPFWKTWWFRILMIALLFMAGRYFYRRRMEKERIEKELLQKKIDEAMHALDSSKKEVEDAKAEVEEHKEQVRLKELEEKELRYFNVGLAKFSDILSQKHELDSLCQAIIVTLVEYLGANLGILYVVSEDDRDAGLIPHGSYGGNWQDGKIRAFQIGEGNVGTCFKRGKVIAIDNLPKDYMNISSGLGDLSPNFVWFVPLVQNEDKIGVMEVAAFEKLEQYKIEFIQKLGENITSTILLMRMIDKNNAIIEETKAQSEELRSQEEEMRQNIEEMMATQEENARLKQKSEKKIEELKLSIVEREKENQDLREELAKLKK